MLFLIILSLFFFPFKNIDAKPKWSPEFDSSYFFNSISPFICLFIYLPIAVYNIAFLSCLCTYQSIQACSSRCRWPLFRGVRSETSTEHIWDAACRPAYSWWLWLATALKNLKWREGYTITTERGQAQGKRKRIHAAQGLKSVWHLQYLEEIAWFCNTDTVFLHCYEMRASHRSAE